MWHSESEGVCQWMAAKARQHMCRRHLTNIGYNQTKACVQDAMEQALALQVKAEHDITSCRAAAAEAEQQLQRTRQEAAVAAEAAWRRQVADHEAAVRIEQESYQAEQVTHDESYITNLEAAV